MKIRYALTKSGMSGGKEYNHTQPISVMQFKCMNTLNSV